ncbi:MAG: beta-galactosidase [Eubacteriales bacterium]|nr:beta-galactosidase [Eubacteriales bacterium]
MNSIADDIQNNTPEDQRRLIFGIWNFNLTSAEELKIAAEAALANGFNAIRIHIPWFHAETEPGVYTFDLFNKQLDYLVIEKDIKVVITVDFTRRTGDDRVISPDEYQYDSGGVLCSGGAFFDRAMISFSSASAVRKANDFYEALCKNLISRYKENILLISPVFSQYAESEYWCAGNYDYSDSAKSGFIEFLKSKYGDIAAFNHIAAASYASFDEIEPPDNFAGNIGLLWYQYRHAALKSFIDSLCDTQKAIDDEVKIGLQFGSVFDEASVQRGTLAFVDLTEKADVMWVDDGPRYDHNWSMDYIGSALRARGKQSANEIDGYYHIQNGNCIIEDYLNQGIQSFIHGTDYLTVANWSIDQNFYDNAEVFRTIGEYTDPATKLLPAEDPVLEVSLYDMFVRRSPAKYITQYNKLTENGKIVCNINITDDLTQKIPDETAVIYAFPASFSDSDSDGELSYRSYDRQTGLFGEMQWSDQYNAWQGDAEFCLVGSGMMHPDILDSAVVFTAPKDGRITYSFSATVVDKNSDGVRMSVLHNGEILYPEQHIKDESLEAEITADVKKGDEVALICNKYKSNSFDSINVVIDISYR